MSGRLRTTAPAHIPNVLIHNFEGRLNSIFGFFETRLHSVAQADLELTVVAQAGPRLLSAIFLGMLSQLYVLCFCFMFQPCKRPLPLQAALQVSISDSPWVCGILVGLLHFLVYL